MVGRESRQGRLPQDREGATFPIKPMLNFDVRMARGRGRLVSSGVEAAQRGESRLTRMTGGHATWVLSHA